MRGQRYPQRDPIKNYFPLPNKIFSLDLCAGEIAVYAYLLRLENRRTYQCWPSYATIGSAVNMSKNTVRKYVAGLEEKGLITTQPTSRYTKDGQTRNGNLLYTIRPIQEAIDYQCRRQMMELEAEAAKRRGIERLQEYNRKHGREPLYGLVSGGVESVAGLSNNGGLGADSSGS